EDDRPRKKARARVDDDEDEAAPRKKKWSRDEDEDDEPKMKRKKRKGVVVTEEDEEKERERENAIVDWGVRLSLMLFGFGMMMFAAFRMTTKGDAEVAVGTAAMMGITTVFALVSIPLTIAALMVIGMVVGIEYGTLG